MRIHIKLGNDIEIECEDEITSYAWMPRIF